MTESKVIGVRVPPYLLEAVQRFQEDHEMPSMGDALRLLLEAGLEAGDGIVNWESLEVIQANARSAAISELWTLVAEVLKREAER